MSKNIVTTLVVWAVTELWSKLWQFWPSFYLFLWFVSHLLICFSVKQALIVILGAIWHHLSKICHDYSYLVSLFVAKLRPRFELSQYACVCVCACYLRQLLTQLRAGGPWHQCGWPETRYWRRVQRVLNPGLLEGSLYFSHSSLSLSPLLTSVTKRMQSFLWDKVSVWKPVWEAFFPELDQVPEMQHVAKLVLASSLNSLIHTFYKFPLH